jgi:hypothetical protein
VSERTVWRFAVEPSPAVQYVVTPGRAKVLAIGPSREGLAMWVEVDQTKSDDETAYCVLGTGWKIPGDAEYVGTYTTPTGFVWHLYAGGAR